MLDLKNTSGEVYESLIQSLLRYHQIPDEFNCIVKLLYSDFGLSVITNDFCTKYIAVEKSILQGDSFSSLAFSIIMNTFIKYVKEEKYTNFGYRAFKGFLPCSWLQFANDWCIWSEMTSKASK